MSFWTDTYQKVRNFKIESSRTRSILLYLFFVLISMVFWAFLYSSEPVTRKVKVPLTIAGVPDDVRFIKPLTDTLTVEIREQGKYFLQRMFKPVQPVLMSFEKYDDGDGVLRVDAARLQQAVLEQLRAQSVTIYPPSITVPFTSKSKLVPVKLDVVCEAAANYTRTGDIDYTPREVRAYGTEGALMLLQEAVTLHVEHSDLTTTLECEVGIKPVADVVFDPATIRLTVPVERQSRQPRVVSVEVRDAPDDQKVLLFPHKVSVFRLPESMSSADVKAFVYYNDIDLTKPGNKVAVRVTAGNYHEDIRISPDSVEYVVEKIHTGQQ